MSKAFTRETDEEDELEPAQQLAPGQKNGPGKSVVFAITKHHAARLAQYLNDRPDAERLTVSGFYPRVLMAQFKGTVLPDKQYDPAQAEILKLNRATRYIATTPENYKGLESAARSAGLL